MCIEKYRRLSAELEETNAYMVELSRLTEKRLNLYKTVRDLYCFLINTLFNSLMTYEKFQAELLFDHDAVSWKCFFYLFDAELLVCLDRMQDIGVREFS